jgi:hypothetical protein
MHSENKQSRSESEWPHNPFKGCTLSLPLDLDLGSIDWEPPVNTRLTDCDDLASASASTVWQREHHG